VKPSFLLVDKDRGWTSHDVVAAVRRIVGVKKVGHAGTLDPMATGLLVVALGRATRLLRFVQGLPKEYLARALFGVATDTLDADGAVLTREPMPVSEEEVTAVMARFLGPILQVPPMVSALKVEGRRLYELAREGVEVERDARPVEIHALALEEFAPSDYPEVLFRVRCSSGTYVRSLADDLAGALGGRAHLTGLRRLGTGSLQVHDARTVAEIEEAWNSGRGDEITLSPAAALRDLPSLTPGDDLIDAVRHGAPISGSVSAEVVGDGDLYRILDDSGTLVAVYRARGRALIPEVVLG
jgi:tRNA pseudouridine55 synthase